MHELSIASAVLDIVQRHADGRRVARVELKVGHLRQVVPSALEFAFELVAEGTEAEGAELVMQEVPARVPGAVRGMRIAGLRGARRGGAPRRRART
jgi:hydrogenase nickel incorporation protein HypA/HybF